VRQNSNVFAMFDQKQIAEFKEAFSMIDHDSDGFIDKEDLKDMLASMGMFFNLTWILDHSKTELKLSEDRLIAICVLYQYNDTLPIQSNNFRRRLLSLHFWMI
jgi:hypothetical protein